MAVDTSYLRQLAVTLASLSRSTAEPCRVHVLHDGVSRVDRDRVHTSVSDLVEIQWINAEAAVRDQPLPSRFPRSVYFRLFLAEALPSDLDRVLYFDADLIVRRPLSDLWSAGLGGAAVGAVRDAYMPWTVRDTAISWRARDVAPESPFFNSGVMLLSLRQWRERDLGARTIALLSETAPLIDQSALNIELANDWAALHPRWNVQSYHLMGDTSLAFAAEGRSRMDAALADPAIVHFTGGSFNRPWQAPCSNPYRDEWLNTLDRTAWSGWRPKPAPRHRRALARTARALRVLRHGGSGTP